MASEKSLDTLFGTVSRWGMLNLRELVSRVHIHKSVE